MQYLIYFRNYFIRNISQKMKQPLTQVLCSWQARKWSCLSHVNISKFNLSKKLLKYNYLKCDCAARALNLLTKCESKSTGHKLVKLRYANSFLKFRVIYRGIRFRETPNIYKHTRIYALPCIGLPYSLTLWQFQI